MLLSNVIVAASAFFSFASATPLAVSEKKSSLVVPRQAAAINTALLATDAEAIKLRDAFSAATGADPLEIVILRAQAQVLLGSVNNCKTVTAASPNLGLLEALGFVSTINRLQTTLESTLTVVSQKKPVVVKLGSTQEVYQTLVNIKAAVNDFGAVLITKLPAAAQSLAQNYIKQFNASFDAAIAVYAPA